MFGVGKGERQTQLHRFWGAMELWGVGGYGSLKKTFIVKRKYSNDFEVVVQYLIQT